LVREQLVLLIEEDDHPVVCRQSNPAVEWPRWRRNRGLP
jgi:hypothetical protein